MQHREDAISSDPAIWRDAPWAAAVFAVVVLGVLVGCAGCSRDRDSSSPESSPAVREPDTAQAPAEKSPVPDGPNVLLIMWDTVRADRMSLYGHSRPTTPNLDEFAKQAVVYERAISPGNWTVPSP